VPGASEGGQRRALLVFSQRGAEPEVDAWDAYGARFLDCRLGPAEPPVRTAAGVALHLVVTASTASPAIVSLEGRAREDADLRLADLAEKRAGGGGLALLARRCPTVWLVERAEDDAAALRLAAVLAGVLLGPIVDVESAEIYGVKTARLRLQTRRP
jgi:hypothetical protein